MFAVGSGRSLNQTGSGSDNPRCLFKARTQVELPTLVDTASSPRYGMKGRYLSGPRSLYRRCVEVTAAEHAALPGGIGSLTDCLKEERLVDTSSPIFTIRNLSPKSVNGEKI